MATRCVSRVSTSVADVARWATLGARASVSRCPNRMLSTRPSLGPLQSRSSLRNSPFQKAAVALGAAVAGFVDPSRGDMVALLGELTGESALAQIRDKMRASPAGQLILHRRPRITTVSLEAAGLRRSGDGTFGREYARYLDAHGYSPDERSQVRAVNDEELAYIMQRYREVHDFWHVLSGLPPSVLGEIALKWLEMAQTGLPMTAFSAFVAPLRLPADQRRQLRTLYIPWAVRCARNAEYLMSVDYEALLPLPLADVQQRLRFEPAPLL